MKKILATVAATLVAIGANAHPRDAWIRKCQAEDPGLANSNGYRVCTELYVVELEKQQRRLVAQLLGRLGRDAGGHAADPAGREHLVKAQELWRNYAEEHCRVVQAVSGGDGPVGDAFPSCSADAFETRNQQLTRLLKVARER